MKCCLAARVWQRCSGCFSDWCHHEPTASYAGLIHVEVSYLDLPSATRVAKTASATKTAIITAIITACLPYFFRHVYGEQIEIFLLNTLYSNWPGWSCLPVRNLPEAVYQFDSSTKTALKTYRLPRTCKNQLPLPILSHKTKWHRRNLEKCILKTVSQNQYQILQNPTFQHQ